MKFIIALLAAFSLNASAQTVKAVDSSKALGTGSLLAIKFDSSSGYHAWALYGSGWQMIVDDASKTKYTKLLQGCGSACLTVDGDPDSLAIAVGRSNGIYCTGGKSLVAFANLGQPVEADATCAFFNKVLANSQ